MKRQFSYLLDRLSNFFAHRKGLLPLSGLLMIAINFILRLTAQGWLVETDFFLHFGLLTTIIGFMLYWVF